MTIQFINESTNKFVDISSELTRTYVFPNGDSTVDVTIYNPTHLSVSTSGHRIFDAQGESHYIPKGWIHLKWKAKEGQPHFVK